MKTQYLLLKKFPSAVCAILFVMCCLAWPASAEEMLVTQQSLTGSGMIGTSGDYYYAGGTIDVWVDMTEADPGTIAAARFEAALPDGWVYTGVGGSQPPEILPLNTTGTIVFRWLGTPPFPISFWYRIVAPSDDLGPQTITGTGIYRVGETQFTTEPLVSTIDLDRLPPAITRLGASVITLDCNAAFVDPWVTAADNAEGDVSNRVYRGGDYVNTSEPGRYEITYHVSDTSGNIAVPGTRTVIVLQNCPGDYCEEECNPDPGTDTDGDGLTDCQERCLYGTNPESADTDGDGMGDAYEVQYAPTLDPNSAADRNADSDGDSLSNIEEFLRGSSPIDPADPKRTYYVAPPPEGVDDEAGGSAQAPWATIGFAFDHALASPALPATIILLAGTYQEDITLRADVTLTGATGEQAILVGTVVGVNAATLSNLEVRALDDTDVLLDLRGPEPDFAGVAVQVFGVTFRNGAIGILLSGDGAGGSIISGCTFTGMNVAIDIGGALPVLRRCVFENLVGVEKDIAVGVHIHALPILGKADEGSLGDVTDPTAGWNTFDTPTIEGLAVLNERAQEIKMEENDWGTDDPDEVAAAISGAADYEPYLAKGFGILAGAVYCTVWDADSQARITNATVQLTPSAFVPITQNDNGVYGYPAVGPGSYSLSVTASGYPVTSSQVLVGDGELVSVIVPMTANETPQPGCCRGENPAKLADNPGDIFIGALAVLLLLAFPAGRRR